MNKLSRSMKSVGETMDMLHRGLRKKFVGAVGIAERFRYAFVGVVCLVSSHFIIQNEMLARLSMIFLLAGLADGVLRVGTQRSNMYIEMLIKIGMCLAIVVATWLACVMCVNMWSKLVIPVWSHISKEGLGGTLDVGTGTKAAYNIFMLLYSVVGMCMGAYSDVMAYSRQRKYSDDVTFRLRGFEKGGVSEARKMSAFSILGDMVVPLFTLCGSSLKDPLTYIKIIHIAMQWMRPLFRFQGHKQDTMLLLYVFLAVLGFSMYVKSFEMGIASLVKKSIFAGPPAGP